MRRLVVPLKESGTLRNSSLIENMLQNDGLTNFFPDFFTVSKSYEYEQRKPKREFVLIISFFWVGKYMFKLF